jgi:glycosyltransferase involved in cell wall biosynthesis
VLLEALAMEIPVVACRAGAIEEALPPDCGVLVEPGPYEETRLAEVLDELLRDPSRRKAMGERGRAFVAKRHALSETRGQYRMLLEEMENAFAAQSSG